MHSATKNKQRGSALVVMLAIVLAAMAFIILKALNSDTVAGRNQATAANMAKAKEALIGFAASYRDTHTGQVNGYLPLPDLGSTHNNALPEEGRTAGSFLNNTADMTVVGRLPWRTLGLTPLHDGAGECLWYAVSGTFQDAQKSKVKFMNWDTLGVFNTFSSNGTAGGTVSTLTNLHQQPVAVIFAPGPILSGSGQVRAAGADVVTECGGNYDARNYLDTFNANPLLNNIVNYIPGPLPNNAGNNSYFPSTTKSLIQGSVNDAANNPLVNDMLLTITADDIFKVIKQRSDFANYVNHDLLYIAQSNLALTLPSPAALDFSTVPPTETAVITATGLIDIGRVPSSALTSNDLKAWQDNLLYARCHSGGLCLTVNGSSCNGVLIFAGDRSPLTVPAQTRATNTDKNTWSNYLEGAVWNNFTNSVPVPTFNGLPAYSTLASSADVLACIQTTPAAQTSFAADFGSFIQAGTNIAPDAATQTVAIGTAAGGGNGCFWLPGPVAVAGKTVRVYYEYQFGYADTYALTGSGTDLGNGITLEIVDGSIPSPPNPTPTAFCGRAADMGAFNVSFPPGATWALESYTIETDVYRDALNSDPVENHTAIMAFGNPQHGAVPGSNGYLTTACNGTAAGCRFSTANQFEEWPTPLLHNQRVEIHTGCNSTCSTCNPASYLVNNYAKVSVWVDCPDCSDVTTDRAQTPTVNRCLPFGPALYSPYIALTGGFRASVPNSQNVILSNFILRSE